MQSDRLGFKVKYCKTCNAIIKQGHGYKSATKYCSYKCYQAKPPRVLEVEAEFKDSIENLIKESETQYEYETDRARSLGINRGTYRAWKIKYKGV